MYFSKSKYVNIYQVIVMSKENIRDNDLLEIEEIFSLYSKCLNSEGWDKYLAKTLKLNTNKFSEFLEKETSNEGDRGVNLEYRTLFNFLQDNVLKKFEASVPSQFSKKEVFKLLISAIFQSSIDGINIDDYEYKDIKKELESYITELEKSMEEVGNEDEDEKKTKDNDGVIDQSYEPSNDLNERLTISRKAKEELKEKMKNEDEDGKKEAFIELLELFIDVENENITPKRRWKEGEVDITPREGEFFLGHMDGIFNNNRDDDISNMEKIITSSRSGVSTRSGTTPPNKGLVDGLYSKKHKEFTTFETDVFEGAKQYIKNLLQKLKDELLQDVSLKDINKNLIEIIETFQHQLSILKLEPLQCFRGDIDEVDPVYSRSYKTTLLRKVVAILSQAFQNSGFLISERIVKLFRDMRGSNEVLDIKQDPLILRLLYKTYLYVTSSLMNHENGSERQGPEHQSLSEAICDKYKINDDFRDIIIDEGGNNEGEKIKMAIAFAFNNNIYF